MMRVRLSENFKLGIVTVIVLLSINFWSFALIDDKKATLLEAAVIGGLLLIVAFNTRVFLSKGLLFKTNVLLFIFIPYLSVLGAYLYHGQPIKLSLLLSRTNFIWLFYFVLHLFNISTEKVIKLMVGVGCVWAFVTIVQQFTYPVAFFYTRGEGSASLFRSNIIRYLVSGQQYGVFVLLYFFYRYTTTKKIYPGFFVGFMLLGLYYYGGRQIAAAAVGSMLIAVLWLKGVPKWNYLFLFFLLGLFVVFVLQPTVITNMIQLTSEQMNNEDYIRFHSANFYLNEYWPKSGWAKLLGNGKPHLDADYGIEMDYITKEMGFWRSDVGIIGAYNGYGLLYALNIIWVNLKGVFLKIKPRKDKYLKLLFFNSLFVILLSVGYGASAVIPFYCLVYYLVDKSFQKGEEEAIPETAESRKRLVPAMVQESYASTLGECFCL